MYTEIYPNLYSIPIPLPNNPLKELNCYMLKSGDQALIVDTGFNMPKCEEAFFKAVDELNIDLKKTVLFISHMHSDHCGLAAKVVAKGAKAYSSEIDGNIINRSMNREYWGFFNETVLNYGLDIDRLSLDDNPAFSLQTNEKVDFTFVKEGDTINIGEFSFTVVGLAGHTQGQIGLYEKNKKLFFCADHILGRITPNIQAFKQYPHALSDYLSNLDKVYKYDVELLLTAHRELPKSHRVRIDELKEHHAQRLAEIMDILNDTKLTVREVACRMTWSLKDRITKEMLPWDKFPNAQKWFASGEVMSHLYFLEKQGKIVMSEKDEVYYFQKK